MEHISHSAGERRLERVALGDASERIVSIDVRANPMMRGDTAFCATSHGSSGLQTVSSAFSALLFSFVAERGVGTLLSFAIDLRDVAAWPATTCLLEWRIGAIEPHFGLKGDIVRLNGRASLPDGSIVLSGSAKAVVYPASQVDPGPEVCAEEIFWSRFAVPA